MTHTDLIARLRNARDRLYFGRYLFSEAADALTAAQERIEALEGDMQHMAKQWPDSFAARAARAALQRNKGLT